MIKQLFLVWYMYLALFQNLSEKLSEQEMQFRRLTQEQLDNFTLDINTAYARLKGIEQAVESEHWNRISLRIKVAIPKGLLPKSGCLNPGLGT